MICFITCGLLIDPRRTRDPHWVDLAQQRGLRDTCPTKFVLPGDLLGNSVWKKISGSTGPGVCTTRASQDHSIRVYAFFLVKCRRKEFGAPVGGKLLELCGILYDMIIRSSFEACPVQGVVVK